MHSSVTIKVGFAKADEKGFSYLFDLTGIMSGLLVNGVFIKRFYSNHGGSDGTTTVVNPSLIGEQMRRSYQGQVF